MILVLTYIFYKKNINSTAIDPIIFIKKRPRVHIIFIKKRSIVHIIFIKKSSIILVLNYIFYNIYPIISVKLTLSSISSALLD